MKKDLGYTQLTIATDATGITLARSIGDVGIVANTVASRSTFEDYTLRKSANTLRAQEADLATFASYLGAVGVSDCPSGKQLQTDPLAWAGVTWGLVAGFVQWMLRQGLAITSVNRKLSSVKAYAELASKAGVIASGELSLINAVSGFAKKEFKRVDEKRTETRQGHKKTQSIAITPEQAKQLKSQPDTPQGRRDGVMMALLLDHGLRVGELVDLQVTDVNLQAGQLVFYRSKVAKTQKHQLTPDTRRAISVYMATDAAAMGQLLRGSAKTGNLTADGMGERSIHERVRLLGEQLGIDGLSPHDCRHYWATRAIAKGADPFALMQAGGWTSMQTVQKYVHENEIANEGIAV